MRKKLYDVLKALRNEDIVSVFTCRLDGISSRVRTEIYEFKHTYNIEIIEVPNFIGRHSAYFLEHNKDNITKVDYLLKQHKENV